MPDATFPTHRRTVPKPLAKMRNGLRNAPKPPAKMCDDLQTVPKPPVKISNNLRIGKKPDVKTSPDFQTGKKPGVKTCIARAGAPNPRQTIPALRSYSLGARRKMNPPRPFLFVCFVS